MNKILLLFFSLFFINPVFSQISLFHEDFEQPSGADSVSSAGTPGWNINTSLAYQGNQSMHSGIAVSDTSYLTTKSFSTMGSTSVFLSFHHIAKISFFDAGIIEISTDSITWTHVTGWNAIYLSSGNFSAPTAWNFRSINYPDWDPGNDSVIPTNNWWKFEAFDLSTLLANQSNVWIRFKLYDGNNSGNNGNYGWLIDNINVLDYNPGFHSLSGTVFYDINNNGVQDPGEPSLPGQTVNISPFGLIVTNTMGVYNQNVIPANYQISYQPLPYWQISTTPSIYNVTLSNQNITNLDFGLTPDTLCYHVTGNLLAGPARCFDAISYSLHYFNSGTLTSDSIRVIFDADPNLTFNNASPLPQNVTGNTYTWTFLGLNPLSGGIIHLSMNVPLPAGSNVTSIMTVMHLDNTGNIVATDIDTAVKIVTCAWDPNDKSVIPPGVQAQNYTLIGEELEYLIRFQNTGNDTAFNVVILDTISPYLNLETFSIIATSHDLTSATIVNGLATFTFENIMLPDSIVDEPNSHGFILYSINHLPNITEMTEIENTAYIYFDFNPAVVTNTTLNTMVSQIPVSVPTILNSTKNLISPNPTTEYIKLDGVKASTFFTIFDLTGREIKAGRLTEGNNLINVKEINPGVYILKGHSSEESFTVKFIKRAE